MSNETERKHWQVLLNRIDGNIARTEQRLGELKIQQEAVQKMLNDSIANDKQQDLLNKKK